ncbi:amino acid/amide ABC transporter substrate-binding protein, HAAT family [Rhizobiales bacterium GAS191]|nr:amino acid/amide ABC transporter substrate-binding protein, HAAT family [Rhizobiales bacterium GAS191]
MTKTGLAAAAFAALMSTTAQAQIADGVLKIGVLDDQSGVYADIGGKWSVEAAKMAVEDFGGKILGAPIQILSADHQNKPDLASTVARQWYDVDHVAMITELTNSAVALAVQGLSREKHKITMATGSATSDLTGKACEPYGFHWAYDTHALAAGTGGYMTKQGGDTWFFLTADYAFGAQLQTDTTAAVEAAGGKVIGAVRHPVNNSDFSSFLLQAQASKAKVIGMANAGLDTNNTVKQAAEFGIVAGGQKLAGMLFTTAEVHGLGLKAAQGAITTEGYYWDLDDKSREFGNRFMKRTGRMPNMIHAGTYSAVAQYLKAVQAVGSDDPDKVAKKLHEMPVDDFFAKGGKVLPNGRMIHDMYLFQIKTPAESKGEWDLYKLLATVPAAEAFFTFEQSGCKLTN